MGRRPKAATEAAEAPGSTAPALVVRRRRRRTVVDHAAQTQLLVNSLLKARGQAGATGDAALTIVNWARGVHEEGAELKTLATRVRKVNAPGVAERKLSYEVNKALLDGVLAGTVTVNVDETGNIVFGDSSAVPTVSEPATEETE